MTKHPDYDYLLKLDKWSKKDAALIIAGLDPEQFRDMQFTAKQLPDELNEPYKIYRILLSINFSNKYGSEEKLPHWYIHECIEKNIELPEDLKIAFQKHLKHQAKIKEIFSASKTAADDNLGVRERKYLLKIIGAIASMHFASKHKKLSIHHDKVNISEIVEDILQFLENNELRSPGLGKSNLHQKIREGIDQFLEEYK